MQYNFHNEKMKMSDVGGVMKEQFREYQDPSKYKNYVNSELSDNNVYKEIVPNGCDWFGQIKEAKALTQETTGRAVRKDAVVLCSTIESVPSTWPENVCKEYFEAKAEWFDRYLHDKGGVDEGSLKSLAVHLDETTPHATYVWTPMMDGKLQAKNILNQNFLRDLQKDSQTFTFNWIENWNTENPERKIEELTPYSIGSDRQHLKEAEYKEQQIETHLTEMRAELERTKLEITQAPDLQTYDTVIQENTALKEELSLKDKLIENLRDANARLQEVATRWIDQAVEWKDKFSDVTHKAGEKLMGFFGYDVSQEKDISLYPTKDVAEGIKAMQADTQNIDIKGLRTLPDNDNVGTFRVVKHNDSGDYETVKSGFSTRTEAEKWQKDLVSGVRSLSDELDNGMHRHR